MILQFLQQIVRWCLNNKTLTIVIYLGLVIWGVLAFRSLPMDVLPDLDRPRVTVFTEIEGRAPEEVEQLVTSPLERVLNGAPGVLAVRSSTMIGLSIINVEFDRGSDVYQNRQVITELLQTVDLPDQAKPILGPTASLLGEIVWVGLTSPDNSHSSTELRSLADWTVKQQLLTIPGIAQIIVMGGSPQEYQILLDPVKLSNYGLSYADIHETIADANVNRGGGFMTDSQQEAPIRIIGRSTKISDLERLVVGSTESGPITLSQIADVRFGSDPNLRGDASINGQPGTLLRIIKQPGVNTLELSDLIDEKMLEVAESLPAGVELRTDLFRQDWFIEEGLDNVTQALRDAIIVIILVITVFLMNGRLTFMTLLSVPLSIIMTFVIFKLMGQGINVMTLGGITIAIGELVDDSIVGVENIRRRLREKKKQGMANSLQEILRIIYSAINEVRGPIVYTTFLGVLAFLPFISLPGLDGRMLAPIGIAYITALVCSTFISVSILPVLASFLLPSAIRKHKDTQNNETLPIGFAHDDTKMVRWVKQLTGRGIRWSLRYPKLILIGMFMCIPVTVLLYLGAGKEGLPELNEPSLTVGVVTPLGSSLEHMRSVADSVASKVLQIEGIESIAMTMGRAEADAHANGPNIAELEVHTDTGIRPQKEMIADINALGEEYKGIANISVGRPLTHRIQELQSGIRAPIVIKVFGPELEVLDGLTEQVLSKVEGVVGVVNAQMKQERIIPQISIELDKNAGLNYGVELGKQVEQIENGLLGIELSEILDGNARYPLVLKFDPSWTNDLTSLSSLPLVVGDDKTISLGQLADVTTIQSPNAISHDNLQRRKVISAYVQGRDVVSAVEDIQSVVGDMNIPEGYTISYEGDYASAQQANRTLTLVGVAVIAGIYLVLLLVLKKHRIVLQTFLDVLTAFMGGMIAVSLSGNILSTAHMVGFVSLLGIVSRNSILVVDHYINLIKHEGMQFNADLIMKGSLERVIPALMTVLTSGIALIPLMIGAGTQAGKEVLAPIATVTFGGLIFSSIIEIFFRPGVFYWMNKDKELIEDEGIVI